MPYKSPWQNWSICWPRRQGKPDSDVARLLADVELTQRLSTPRLIYWQQQFPGAKSRQSLLVIADASAFLKLPPEEAPPSTPSLAVQRQIMSLVANYVADTIHQLPNFFARQITTHFEDQPMRRSTASSAAVIYKPLHPAGTPTVSSVLYRDGREVIDPGPVNAKKSDAPAAHLKTQGVFGPILQIVLIDAARNKLAWSHWEQGDAGQLAVFGYSVPQENSHYYVTYCCVTDPNDLAHPNKEFRQIVGFHGEIAADPTNGAIRRITCAGRLQNHRSSQQSGHAGRICPGEYWGPHLYLPGEKYFDFSRAARYISRNFRAGRL